MRHWRSATAVWVTCVAALIANAYAQEKYPTRPIRMLIPFPAGGAADTIGRSLGEQLSTQLGQPVVADNRPGAAGRVATEMLTRAEPDGYTLLMGGVGPLCISPAAYRKLPYDVQRDFLGITRVAEIINVMVVHPSSGVGTVAEFIDWRKKRPGDVRFGSSGPAQLDHLAAEFFQRVAGITMTHVPYKGGGPAMIDLLSGDLQVMFATYVTAVPHLRSGRLRAIAVSTPKRQPLLPDLPAVAETLPGFGVSNWNGIFVPARTSRAVADRLFVEINKAMLAPEVKKRQHNVGIEPVGSASRAEFEQLVRDERARWSKIVTDAQIRIE